MSTPGNNTGSVTLTTVTKTDVTTNVNSTLNLSSTATANTITIGETAYLYMRPKTITFTARGLKPNTTYFPFFDNVDVSAYCSTVSNVQSSPIKTNALGEVIGNFYLPANTFPTGSHLFQLVDNVRNVGGTLVPDAIYGAAEARYEANGILRTQQTQVTIDTTAQLNTVVTTAISNTTNSTVDIKLPPVVQCESWYFEYAVYSGSSYVFTVTTNSSAPPDASLVQPSVGSPGIITQSVTYVSTSSGGGGVWYHTYVARTSVGGSTVAVRTFRQEWVGTTTESRPNLADFRPSGLAATDRVAVITPWIKVGVVACPVRLGLGSATQLTTRNAAPYDPVAQSFFVEADKYPQGIFVTSISVYFRTVDQSTPVILELRNMTNGFPGPQVFPGGKSLIPGAAAAQSPDASVATVFRFDFPVYLAPGNEYCFVLKSASLGYNCWCSKLGEVDVRTGAVIDAQPSLGTLFLSENNYTWIPDSTQDVMFDLNIAAFDTTKVGDVVFRPQQTGTSVLNYAGTAQNLPLSYLSTTKGTKTIRARIPLHGLVTGDKIHIEGIAAPVVATLYNNIRVENLNGTHTVTVIDGNTVQFTVGGSFDASKSGPLPVRDEFNIVDTTTPLLPPEAPLVAAPRFINAGTLAPTTIPTASDLVQPTPPTNLTSSSFIVYTNVTVNEVMVDYLGTKFEQTDIVDRISLATSTSTSGVEVPYAYQALADLPKTNDFYSFEEPRLIATPLNETVHLTELQSPAPTSNTSATVNLRLTSQNKDISPIIDTNGMSLVVRSYVIDNQNNEMTTPIAATAMVAGQGYVIATTGNTNYTLVGAPNNLPGTSFIATAAAAAGTTGTVYLNSEILPGVGIALAKYKTPVQSTADTYNNIQLFVTANSPAPARIEAYVRTSTDRETHGDQSWDWMPIGGVFGTAFRHSADALVMNEWFYEITLPDTFNVYDIKLVMRSTNNSIVPKIHGLRTILNNK